MGLDLKTARVIRRQPWAWQQRAYAAATGGGGGPANNGSDGMLQAGVVVNPSISGSAGLGLSVTSNKMPAVVALGFTVAIVAFYIWTKDHQK